MSEAGLQPDAVQIGDYSMESGRAAAERLFALHPDVTALVSANDLMAFGAWQWLHQHGREVPREQTPNPACWPFESAIQCGASLAAYRQTAIEAARQAFPTVFIAACGGFHRREEAFRACEHANVIVENEAYTRYGPGIVLQLLHKLVLRLRYLQRAGQIDSEELWDFQQARWQSLVSAPANTSLA